MMVPSVPPPDARPVGRLKGAAALKLHLTLAGGLVLATGAFIFEIFRALGGNKLSWLYVFEWPILGGFGIYMWWKLYNGNEPRPARRETSSIPSPLPQETGDTAELAAWNAYVRSLEAGDEDVRSSS